LSPASLEKTKIAVGLELNTSGILHSTSPVYPSFSFLAVMEAKQGGVDRMDVSGGILNMFRTWGENFFLHFSTTGLDKFSGCNWFSPLFLFPGFLLFGPLLGVACLQMA
jgi:hypothetical protein